jgi:hypothetical protein
MVAGRVAGSQCEPGARKGKEGPMRKLVLTTVAVAFAALLTSFAPRSTSPANIEADLDALWLIETALAAPMVPGALVSDAR